MKAEYFVYVGNAYPHKNLNRLIGAMVLLNKELKSKTLLKIVSSRNVFTQKLNAEINTNKASSFITLVNSTSDNELSDLYKNSVGYISPSLSEGFGLPGVEAMRAETLVIASDIPVFREIYQDNAIYFDPLNIDSIKIAMLSAIRMQTKEREERIKKAKDFVKRYSWAKMAKEILKIYEGCNSIR